MKVEAAMKGHRNVLPAPGANMPQQNAISTGQAHTNDTSSELLGAETPQEMWKGGPAMYAPAQHSSIHPCTPAALGGGPLARHPATPTYRAAPCRAVRPGKSICRVHSRWRLCEGPPGRMRLGRT